MSASTIDSLFIAKIARHIELAFLAACGLLMWYVYGISVMTVAMMVAVGIGCIALWYLQSRHANAATINTVAVVIMAMIVGFLQLCFVVAVSFGLLFALKVISTESKHRTTLIASAMLMVVASFFFSRSAFEYDLFCHQNLVGMFVFTLSCLIAGIRFWQLSVAVQSEATTHQALQHRLTTTVGVINKLTRFMPPQIWKPIIRDNAPVVIHNKRKQLTIMFSDIAGFTQLSDSLSADDLADILNEYMTRMTQIAKRHHAVLDKFIGDGMVCFFGAPNSKGVREDAIACVAMAIDMRREMRTLCHQWQLRGFAGLNIRIGISTGYCHVGNFGSDARMSYTVIGREVNLASRLESMAQLGAILISKSTFDYVKHDYQCVNQGDIQLKGFSEPVPSYQVQDPDYENQISPNWVDHDLPGFNLHLNFKEIKNYDYRLIKSHLEQALYQVQQKTSQGSDDHEI